jgi:TIR domain/Pentapeptide repeats (8 copies)
MPNPEHLKILKQGAATWNRWRKDNPTVLPDLTGASFTGASLTGASLTDADFTGAVLRRTFLNGAVLRRANLSDAVLSGAVLRRAFLDGAVLRGAYIYGANLFGATLEDADFTGVWVGYTSFGDNDLSRVKGLESVVHRAPSTIGVDTIYKSRGEIPEVFLRGCGVPDDFITYMRSLVVRPIQFYSCFISYSTRDEEFARRLYSRMRDEGLRVWFAPEEMKGGEKLHEQIDRAIQVHDKLLLILSEESMRSEWVLTEIRRARRTEVKENRRKLFPISIVDFEKVRAWERLDADTGRDLAGEVREYFIPDFSNWKEHDAFEAAFARLLRDLKAEEKG